MKLRTRQPALSRIQLNWADDNKSSHFKNASYMIYLNSHNNPVFSILQIRKLTFREVDFPRPYGLISGKSGQPNSRKLWATKPKTKGGMRGRLSWDPFTFKFRAVPVSNWPRPGAPANQRWAIALRRALSNWPFGPESRLRC